MRDLASRSEYEPDVPYGNEEEPAFLDELLLRVGAPTPQIPSRRRNRRKIRRSLSRTTKEEDLPVVDVGELDQSTVAAVPLRQAHKGPIRITVQHRPHVQSPFILSLQGLAQPIHEEVRLPRERVIHEWSAPIDIVLSPEALLSEAVDLHIAHVDPFVFHQQFTPTDPEIAFQEAYGAWNRLRAPFIRWEVARAEGRKYLVTTIPERVPTPIIPTEHLPVDFHEQWTSGDPVDEVRRESGFLGFRRRFASLFSHVAEDFEDVVAQAEDRGQEIMTETERVWGIPVLVPRVDFVKVFGGLAGLLLIASLPAGAVSLSRSFRGTVEESLNQGRAAVADVAQVTNSADPLATAPSALAQASERFRAAEDGLQRVNSLATLVVRSLPQTRAVYDSSVALLDVGALTTKAGRLVSEGVHGAMTNEANYPVERLATLQTYIDAAIPTLAQAKQRLSDVKDESLPVSERGRVAQVRTAIATGSTALDDISATLTFARALLGESREQTYLLVFQNQAELRPTGGFMGSVAELMIDRGEITHTFIPGGGPYDLRGQLKSRVLAPKPLYLVNPRWEFQDANWFPDFAASAEKINWFWSQGGQSTLDGVISVNASLLEPLLRFTGPIELPSYGKTFTADNIQLELQKSVELEYDKTENQPKKIIGDLFPVILDRLKSAPPERTVQLVQLLDEAFRKKDVQLWFRNADLQAYAEKFGWAGRLKSTQGDALSVVEANIGGQKTDAVIREAVDQQITVLPDGHLEATLTLDRTHDGKQGELFRGANNVEYLRVYVPQGSELLSVDGVMPPTSTAYKAPLSEDQPDKDLARLVNLPQVGPSGADVTQEFDRTAFGVWVQLKPGQQSRTVFHYRLPFTIQELSERAMSEYAGTPGVTGGAYTLYLTSQSGKSDRQFTFHLNYPASWNIRWSNREDVTQTPGVLAWSGALSQDEVFAFSFAFPPEYDQANKAEKGS